MKKREEFSAGGVVYRKFEIRNSKFEIRWLVTKHSQFGHWSFPKGLVGDKDPEESVENAALREVREEGGVDAEIVEELSVPVEYKYKFEDSLIEKKVQYFLMRYLEGDPAEHDWEVEEAKFVTAPEVRELLTFESDKQVFEHAVEMDCK